MIGNQSDAVNSLQGVHTKSKINATRFQVRGGLGFSGEDESPVYLVPRISGTGNLQIVRLRGQASSALFEILTFWGLKGFELICSS